MCSCTCKNHCEWERCVIISKYENTIIHSSLNNIDKYKHQYWNCINGGVMQSTNYDYWIYSNIGDTVEIDTNCTQQRVNNTNQ